MSNSAWPTEHVPRYKWGDYEALSYTWGTDKRGGRIVLNGKVRRVQKNLEVALRELQALPETQAGMRYWIDAVCINQGNIEERNVQVKRMQDIYGKSWAVLVWLGEESDDSDGAADLITRIDGMLDPGAAVKAGFEGLRCESSFAFWP